MILSSYYQDANGTKVYLSECDSSNVFYILGSKLVVATRSFFSSKYSLCR